MKFLLLCVMFVLLLICFVFQVRDIYIMKKYKRTDNTNFKCGHLKTQINRIGHTISECGNVFCCDKFKENDNNCPSNCQGRIYSDAPNNLELIFCADNFYCTKKIVYLSTTIFASILTILNIIDRI